MPRNKLNMDFDEDCFFENTIKLMIQLMLPKMIKTGPPI